MFFNHPLPSFPVSDIPRLFLPPDKTEDKGEDIGEKNSPANTFCKERDTAVPLDYGWSYPSTTAGRTPRLRL